uniref:Uncharacterized protein n=1 Tax=Onchocerca volvulus TaxID=6282 RepID=A0A8R1Y1H7_ONCVO
MSRLQKEGGLNLIYFVSNKWTRLIADSARKRKHDVLARKDDCIINVKSTEQRKLCPDKETCNGFGDMTLTSLSLRALQ